MKRAMVALGLLAAVCGSAWADDPRISMGPGSDPITLPPRESVCQYGFTDDWPGVGYVLCPQQQLGMQCAIGPTTITRVGFFCEYVERPGDLDIVIRENDVELSRTTVAPAEGVNEFDTPGTLVSGTACIMLCPIDFEGVTGEDTQSPPYGNCYASQRCECTHSITEENLTIWAVYDASTPAGASTWSTLKGLFR